MPRYVCIYCGLCGFVILNAYFVYQLPCLHMDNTVTKAVYIDTIDMFLHWQSHVVVTRSKIITIPQNFNYLNKYKRPVLMMSIMIKRMVFLVILVGVRNVHISLLLILLYLRLISKLLYIIKVSEYWTEGAIKNV